MSTNDFIDDFIEEYKNQPCLWKANSTNYKNRNKRQEAYMKLIEVAANHGEHYNIERTKQKINNLRCAFRHQLKKYTECKNNKSGKEEPYCPKRRYFESLMFLMEEEKPANRIKLAEKLKEIRMTRVITRKESPTGVKEHKLPMKISVEAIDASNGGTVPAGATVEQQEDEVIELDPDDGKEQHHHHQMEPAEMQDESQNCTVHSEDISVAGESVKDAGGVVYHTDVQQSDDDEEGFKILWPAKPMEGIQTNYIRMAPPQSPPVVPTGQSSQTQATASAPMTTTIIHHDLTNSGHTSSATQIALPTSITIQPVPKQGDTVITGDGLQHGTTIRRRTVSVCSNKSQSQISQPQQPPLQDPYEEPQAKKVKIDCTSSDFEKLLTLACSKMNTPDPQPEDSFAMFGKMVAHKMRVMDSQQALYAEKIIFDILFDGQMKLLKYPYPVPTQYGISQAIPVSRSTLYPIRHTGSSSGQHSSIVATSSHQPPPQTFVISSVDCHGTPTEIHATSSAHQTHYSPQSGSHYTTTTINEGEVEEQL